MYVDVGNEILARQCDSICEDPMSVSVDSEILSRLVGQKNILTTYDRRYSMNMDCRFTT